MREFIHNYENHLDEAFDTFKKTHQKDYKNGLDHMYRKDLFRQNIRYSFVRENTHIYCKDCCYFMQKFSDLSIL